MECLQFESIQKLGDGFETLETNPLTAFESSSDL